MTTVEHITSALASVRMDLSNELLTQAGIATALQRAGIPFRREVDLGLGDRIDFLCVDGVGIEVKLSGSARDIHRQLVRYCRHDDVRALILATAKSIGLPKAIDAKPCFVVSLSRGWL
jgi:hypothetical protein